MSKVVIIGSGLGGLSCGCILAKNGHEVIVLEQDDKIGGCLQCFSRGGVSFDTGMHYIGSMLKGQTLDTLTRFLGIRDSFSLSQLDPSGFDIISFGGEHYRFANGEEPFIDSLAEHFPDSRDELRHYYELTERVAASSAFHTLSDYDNHEMTTEFQARSADEVIADIVKDERLQQVLASEQLLYAGRKGYTPFFTHALISDFYAQSAFRIIGGSDKVAHAMAAEIAKNGGKVLVRERVSRIECDEKRATAVLTTNGNRYEGDIIISSLHPSRTIELVQSPLIRPAYRHRIEQMGNTIGAFTVYIKFKKHHVKYLNSNLYIYRGPTTWGCEQYDERSWPKSVLFMHQANEPLQQYAETAEALTYMNFSDVSRWLGTHTGRRGAEYEAFKRNKAERVIDVLETEMPGIRDCIEQYYTSTLLTYLDYTGTPSGAMYGIAKNINAIDGGNISCRTRIPNLLLTGQSIASHGMLGTLAGSLITCSEVLGREKIFSQLNSIKEQR